MTTTNEAGVDRIQTATPVARPDQVGQATSIEQSRALAEVQAAAYLARQFPRDITTARAEMLDSCNQMGLAERSMFSFRRGGGAVTGASVHLARELARCWGNIQYGLIELSRDDHGGSSQMIAYAWDVQTNARSSSTFIVPHIRDTKSGGVKLTETRDIYENNANQGARRVREAIFAVLPTWFTEEAKAACRTTLENGGGKALPVRIDEMIQAFALGHITLPQLEARVGIEKARWTAQEVATLGIVFTSLRNGETRREDEFPPAMAPVTGAEVVSQAAPAAAPAAAPPTETPPAAETRPATAVLDEIYAAAATKGMTDADVEDDFVARNEGATTLTASVEQLQAYLGLLKTGEA